jgi:hypothetical protein
MHLTNLADIRESNGKTVRENNQAKPHKYPIGTLVRFKFTSVGSVKAEAKGEATAYVCEHNRDCDGSPLYSMSLIAPASLGGAAATLVEYADSSWMSNLRLRAEAVYKVWFFGHSEDSLEAVQ